MQDYDGPEFEEGAQWRRTVGKRMARSLGFVTDQLTAPLSSVMGVVLVPLNFIFSWFLKLAALRSKDPLAIETRSAALDLQLEWASPVHFVLQHLSNLLMLAWTAPTLPALLRQYARPAAAVARVMVHRLVRMAWLSACHLTMRFPDRLSMWPYRLQILADMRQSPSAREACAKAFCSASPCCLPPGAARAIYKLLQIQSGDMNSAPDPRLLLTDRWRFVFTLSAAEIDYFMSDIEDQHGHCKASSSATGTTSAELMCAKHVLRQSRHMHTVFQANRCVSGVAVIAERREPAPQSIRSAAFSLPASATSSLARFGWLHRQQLQPILGASLARNPAGLGGAATR